MLKLADLKIERPIIIASGPLTAKAKHVKEAEDCGAGAASLKLTFVRVPFPGQMRTYSTPNGTIISPIDKRLNLNEAIELLRECKKTVRMPLFANLGAVGTHLDEWRLMAQAFQDAGIDALELNYCCPNLDTTALTFDVREEHGGAQIGQNPKQCYAITKAIRDLVRIPIVCKFLPNAADVRDAAVACERGGADGVHVVGLPVSGLPPVNVFGDGEPLIGLTDGISFGSANGTICKHSTFMAIAQVASVIKIPIIASGGLDDWRDCVSAVMWGASALSVCSAPMWHGFEVVRQMTDSMQEFMAERGYRSWLDFRGKSLKYLTTPDKIRLIQGAAKIDADRCIGCGRCARPGHCDAMAMQERPGERPLAVSDPQKCIGCGVCLRLCPVGAIQLLPT